jgi:hypothetical protein
MLDWIRWAVLTVISTPFLLIFQQIGDLYRAKGNTSGVVVRRPACAKKSCCVSVVTESVRMFVHDCAGKKKDAILPRL